MKKIIAFIVLLFFFVASCSDSSTDVAAGFNGQWRITVDDETETCTIDAGSDYMSFCGETYNGSGTSTKFSGTNETTYGGIDYENSISINRSGDNISGSITVRMYYSGKWHSNTESLTGYRIK
jgi:hypothetical protein